MVNYFNIVAKTTTTHGYTYEVIRVKFDAKRTTYIPLLVLIFRTHFWTKHKG